MYDIEKLVYPKSVPEAIAALQADPSATIICGGSDVLIKIREGKLAGCSLVSIREIPALAGITMRQDGAIVIGPTSTFAEVTNSPIVQQHIPTLGEAVDQAGGPQLRNIGTIGGNICNGVTSADSATTLLTLNAILEITGPNGKRTVAQEHFYKGPGKVELAQDELLTAIIIEKKEYESFGGHYIKYAMRDAMDIATLGCAVHVKLSADKRNISDLRLSFGVAAPVPVRCHTTEESAKGMAIGADLYAKVSQLALTEVNPRTSWRASKEFRLQLVKELSQRALKHAITNAGGIAE